MAMLLLVARACVNEDMDEGEDAKERKQQGGVVDAEIEEVIEGEMADSPHSAKATADSDRVDKSASAKGVQMSSASAKGVQISAKAPEKSSEVKGKRPQERLNLLPQHLCWDNGDSNCPKPTQSQVL